MSSVVHAITPALAHVGSESNLLVRNVRACDEGRTWRSVFAVDGAHPYLYENPAIANHVSGTTFIDMARQLLKAISHLYWDAPLDSRFILHNVDIEFLRWAQLGVDIEVTVTGEATHARKADAMRSCEAELVWRQRGHLLARGRSRFTILTAALEARLMERQYRQAPLVVGAEAPDTDETGPAAPRLHPPLSAEPVPRSVVPPSVTLPSAGVPLSGIPEGHAPVVEIHSPEKQQ